MSKKRGLVNHPLVLTLLEQKLASYGWIYLYANLIYNLILLVFITIFMLIIPKQNLPECKWIYNAYVDACILMTRESV